MMRRQVRLIASRRRSVLRLIATPPASASAIVTPTPEEERPAEQGAHCFDLAHVAADEQMQVVAQARTQREDARARRNLPPARAVADERHPVGPSAASRRSVRAALLTGAYAA